MSFTQSDKITCAAIVLLLCAGAGFVAALVGLIGGSVETAIYNDYSPGRDVCRTFLKGECLYSCGCLFCGADSTCYSSADASSCAGNATITEECEHSMGAAVTFWIVFGIGAGLTLLGLLGCVCLVYTFDPDGSKPGCSESQNPSPEVVRVDEMGRQTPPIVAKGLSHFARPEYLGDTTAETNLSL